MNIIEYQGLKIRMMLAKNLFETNLIKTEKNGKGAKLIRSIEDLIKGEGLKESLHLLGIRSKIISTPFFTTFGFDFNNDFNEFDVDACINIQKINYVDDISDVIGLSNCYILPTTNSEDSYFIDMKKERQPVLVKIQSSYHQLFNK